MTTMLSVLVGIIFALTVLFYGSIFVCERSIKKDWRKAQADYERTVPFTLLRGAYERNPDDWELLYYYAKYKGNAVGLPTYREWNRYWAWRNGMKEDTERKRKEAEKAEKKRKSDELAAELLAVYAEKQTPPKPPTTGTNAITPTEKKKQDAPVLISAIVRSWDGKITIPAEKGRPVAGNGDEKIFGYVQNLGPVETLNDGRPYNIDPDSGEVFYPAIKGNFYKVYYWVIKPSVEILVVGGDHDLEELKQHIEKLKTTR